MHTRLLPVGEVVRCLAAARVDAVGGVHDQSVSVDQALEEANRREIPWAEELSLYLIHGWLHLVGFQVFQPTLY